jgi:5'(3')-deoxyribonucleotidase
MPKPASKPLIVIDVDEVLAVNAAGFVEYSNKRWDTHLTVDDYHEHWGELWEVDEEETEKRAIEYHLSGTIQKLNTIANAQLVLKKLSVRYDMVVLTSRRKLIEKETKDWINDNFPKVFSEVRLAGIWDEIADNRMSMTKADHLVQLGAQYFIDDQPRHCYAAAEVGVKTLLFGDYHWNRGLKLPKGVTWVKDWQEVLEYFDAKTR